MPARRTPPNRERSGQTLVELIAAGVLLAGALVPALRLMSDGLVASERIEMRSLMTNYCVSKLDQALAATAASWQSTTTTGNLAAEGYPTLRFRVQTSDAPASGGIAGRLMAVTCSVWQDVDSNSVWGPDEAGVTLSSKLAKMAVYQDVVTP